MYVALNEASCAVLFTQTVFFKPLSHFWYSQSFLLKNWKMAYRSDSGEWSPGVSLTDQVSYCSPLCVFWENRSFFVIQVTAPIVINYPVLWSNTSQEPHEEELFLSPAFCSGHMTGSQRWSQKNEPRSPGCLAFKAASQLLVNRAGIQSRWTSSWFFSIIEED